MLYAKTDYDRVYDPARYLLTGHIPTFTIDPACDGKIYRKNGHIAIDCGVCHGKALGCIRLDDMKVEGQFLVYSDGMIRELYDPSATYEQLKAKYVKRLFSNDDQIAIMLNKDKSAADAELFDKMQEWRDWCGVLAKKVISMKN